MANYLFQQQCTTAWMGQGAGLTEGVLVGRGRQDYIACPASLLSSELAYSCLGLNVVCAMTINSRVVKTFLAFSPNVTSVPLRNGLRVQILPTISDLSLARKTHYAAIVALDGLLDVWDDGEWFRQNLSSECAPELTTRRPSTPLDSWTRSRE